MMFIAKTKTKKKMCIISYTNLFTDTLQILVEIDVRWNEGWGEEAHVLIVFDILCFVEYCFVTLFL